MDMGSDRSGGQAQCCGNHGRTVSLQPHIVDGDFILQSHSDTPSVMTAKVMGSATSVGYTPRIRYRLPAKRAVSNRSITSSWGVLSPRSMVQFSLTTW